VSRGWQMPIGRRWPFGAPPAAPAAAPYWLAVLPLYPGRWPGHCFARLACTAPGGV